MSTRFTKSEYTVQHELDKSNQKRTVFLDTDTQSLVLWSGEGDIPEIGEVVSMGTPMAYEGIVVNYHISYGWIGVKVLPRQAFRKALHESGYGNYKADFDKNPDTALIWNYGTDLIGEAV